MAAPLSLSLSLSSRRCSFSSVLSLPLSLMPSLFCCCCGAPHLCWLFFIVFVWEFLFAPSICLESCFCFLPILKRVWCFEPETRTRTRPRSLWLGPWRVSQVKKARACEWKEGGHEGLLVCSSMSKQAIMLAHWIADKEALMFALVGKQGTGSIFQVGGSLRSGWTHPEQVCYAISFDLWRRKPEKSRLSTSQKSCLSRHRLLYISCTCLLARSFILCSHFQVLSYFRLDFFSLSCAMCIWISEHLFLCWSCLAILWIRCMSESMDTCSSVDHACISIGSCGTKILSIETTRRLT
jgi:hypothetical protein